MKFLLPYYVSVSTELNLDLREAKAKKKELDAKVKAADVGKTVEEVKKVEQEAEASRKVRIKEAQEEVRRKHAQGAQTAEEFEQALISIVGDDEAAAKAKIKAADEAKKQAAVQHAAISPQRSTPCAWGYSLSWRCGGLEPE